MKTVSYSNLPDLGINPLTGEACAFSMRILCDLDEIGVSLIKEYLGLAHDTTFQKNWNSSVGGHPAVAAVMLERSMFPALVRFALFRQGYRYVLQEEGGTNATGFNDEDQRRGYTDLSLYIDGTSSLLKENGGCLLLHRNPRGGGGQPYQGSRNVHAFTGRTV